MQSAHLYLYFINVFQMNGWGLLRRTYYLNEQQTNHVFIYVNDNLKGREDCNSFWSHIFKRDAVVHSGHIKRVIPKNEVDELGDPQHTLSVFCGRYIRITSEKTQVHLSKNICHRYCTSQVLA